MSLPSRERGLKLNKLGEYEDAERVAPFAGAWIEINWKTGRSQPKVSLPSRERGLKLKSKITLIMIMNVAPFAGAWIEIWCCPNLWPDNSVAPFAGAWIEIYPFTALINCFEASLPSRERGLKFFNFLTFIKGFSRSLRGSVD